MYNAATIVLEKLENLEFDTSTDAIEFMVRMCAIVQAKTSKMMRQEKNSTEGFILIAKENNTPEHTSIMCMGEAELIMHLSKKIYDVQDLVVREVNNEINRLKRDN